LSSIVTEQGVVHYEAMGRGKPVVLLHGWLGSWGCWLSTMEALAPDFRTYALDFWGFGESDKRRERYEIADFAALVDQFMGRLGILQAPVVGHSMGGTVALRLALSSPQRVSQVAVVGSPVDGRSLNIFLKLAGTPWVAYLVWHSPRLLRLGIRLFAPWIARNHAEWYAMLERDLSQLTLESFLWSIRSLRDTDLRDRIGAIRVPALGVYGMGDAVVNPDQAEEISNRIPDAQVAMLRRARHFPMLDDPDRFMSVLLEFLHSHQEQA
jgi:pimeloyl-ACP methyl ester carboxylesterase